MRAPPRTATSAANRRTMAASRGRRPISSARSAVRSPEQRPKLRGGMTPAAGMTAKIPDSPAARRFFGRRKGYRLRAHQAELIETLLPRLALDLRQPAAEPLTALFPVPVTEVRLEIGFGGGDHLIPAAGRNPHIGFLGCQPCVNGLAKALPALGGPG